MGVNAAIGEGPLVKMNSDDESATQINGEEDFWSGAV